MKLSIASFDAVAESEQGAKLELKNPNGSETGLTMFVLGSNAEIVRRHFTKLVRENIRKNEINQKKGKSIADDYDAIELQAKEAESCAVRVTGWHGVDEPFDSALLISAFKRNPHWVEQVNEFSNDLSNFTKKA